MAQEVDEEEAIVQYFHNMAAIERFAKALFEEQVRRATIVVKWKEGKREASFDVVRFFVANPPSQQAPNPNPNPNGGPPRSGNP